MKKENISGVSSEMAVVAGIVGGILFLLLFLMVGCFLMLRGRQKKSRKRRKPEFHSQGETFPTASLVPHI